MSYPHLDRHFRMEDSLISPTEIERILSSPQNPRDRWHWSPIKICWPKEEYL
jgi:hypothetical protein